MKWKIELQTYSKISRQESKIHSTGLKEIIEEEAHPDSHPDAVMTPDIDHNHVTGDHNHEDAALEITEITEIRATQGQTEATQDQITTDAVTTAFRKQHRTAAPLDIEIKTAATDNRTTRAT